jgi:hypothetical protein
MIRSDDRTNIKLPHLRASSNGPNLNNLYEPNQKKFVNDDMSLYFQKMENLENMTRQNESLTQDLQNSLIQLQTKVRSSYLPTLFSF